MSWLKFWVKYKIRKDVFISTLKSYEVKNINDVINENLLIEYDDGIVGHNGLRVLEIGNNIYYIQTCKAVYRVYLDGQFLSEMSEEELSIFVEQLLKDE